ncbi:MAG: iron donor protein CyaY [Myxococcales bacterium]|nr:iron donor protein CyaY [Myxococcales bacterium]
MAASKYRERARQTMTAIVSAFDDVDADDVDVEEAGDVIHLRFRGGSRCVINTQSPVEQIWLAGEGRGWHFSYDETHGKWVSDKDSDEELFAVIARITKNAVSIDLTF